MKYRTVIPTILVAFSIILWFVASNFRSGVGQYDVVGPSFFPKLILLGLAVVSLCDLVLAAHRRVRANDADVGARSPDELAKDDGSRERASLYWVDLLLAAGMTIGYVLLLPHIGFAVRWELCSSSLRCCSGCSVSGGRQSCWAAPSLSRCCSCSSLESGWTSHFPAGEGFSWT
jgi:hypothetical protein